MVAKTFTNASGTWDVGTNWTPAGVPGATDDAFINQPGTYTVTLNNTEAVNTVTLNDPNATLAIASGGVLLPNSAIAVAIALEAGTLGFASGAQIISGTIVNTGATLAMTGGTLDGVTWVGRLGQDAGFGSVVIKDGIALEGAGGTLPGTLEISGLFSVSIADANPLDHMIIDFGNFNIEHLTGSGSFSLIFNPAVTVNQTAPGASGDITGVELDNHGLMNLESSGGSFFIGSSTFDNFGSMIVGNDHVTVGGTFSNSGSVAVSASGLFSIGSNPGTNSGSIDITTAGTLSSGANIGGTGVISLSLSGLADVHNVAGTVDFLGSSGTLKLEAPGTFTGSIEGFQKGDKINLPGQTVTALNPMSTATSTTLEVLNGTTTIVSLNLLGNYESGFVFNHATDGAGGTNITVVCYAAGTRLLTAHGEVAVENLQENDLVVALSDHGARLKPVRWIGRLRADLDRHPRPESVAPIRVRAGAFADGAPHRDLLLSPDHSVLVAGAPDVLIPARYLVNGVTVMREPASGVVDYYHVELDRHGIVIAEGLPAESYLDTGNRAAFVSADAVEPSAKRNDNREARARG